MNSKVILGAIVAVLIAAAAFWAIDVDVTGDVELPEIVADVDMRGGEMPNVDVNTVDVDVSTEPKTIEVPDVDVDVDTTEMEIQVPEISIDKPEEDTYAEEDDL